MGFASTFGFHDAESYRRWLAAVGLEPGRVELIAKDMMHNQIRQAWFISA